MALNGRRFVLISRNGEDEMSIQTQSQEENNYVSNLSFSSVFPHHYPQKCLDLMSDVCSFSLSSFTLGFLPPSPLSYLPGHVKTCFTSGLTNTNKTGPFVMGWHLNNSIGINLMRGGAEPRGLTDIS